MSLLKPMCSKALQICDWVHLTTLDSPLLTLGTSPIPQTLSTKDTGLCLSPFSPGKLLCILQSPTKIPPLHETIPTK